MLRRINFDHILDRRLCSLASQTSPFVVCPCDDILLLDMADANTPSKSQKRCFVTIGATAPFNSLVQGVLEPAFIHALQEAGYVELRVQYGDHEGESIFQSRFRESNKSLEEGGLTISGFGFNRSGLREEMAAVKGLSKEDEGIVISHAGQLA